jgi:hypothetical protein
LQSTTFAAYACSAQKENAACKQPTVVVILAELLHSQLGGRGLCGCLRVS